MSRMKRFIRNLLAVCVVALFMARPVMAEGTTIDRITLVVTSDIQVGAPCSAADIEAEVMNEGCHVGDIQLVNDGETWGSADVPRVLVFLNAEPGYTFDLDRSRITITGAEFEYIWREESLGIYTIQVRLPSLREQTGEIAEARWDGLTLAAWSGTYNVAYYEVQLFNGDRKVGPLRQITSESCDFGSYMRIAGQYRYQVRAVNRRDARVKSEWIESPVSVVDNAAAEQNRQQYPPAVAGPVGGGPQSQTAVPYYEGMYGWIAEGERWWYRNGDGSYTTNNWQLIDGKWYYFDSKGYMVTGWIDWNDKSYYCDPVSGAMLTNVIVPDGLGRRVDSTGAWIE